MTRLLAFALVVASGLAANAAERPKRRLVLPSVCVCSVDPGPGRNFLAYPMPKHPEAAKALDSINDDHLRRAAERR